VSLSWLRISPNWSSVACVLRFPMLQPMGACLCYRAAAWWLVPQAVDAKGDQVLARCCPSSEHGCTFAVSMFCCWGCRGQAVIALTHCGVCVLMFGNV
jgi:hypothetical protein